MGERDTVQKIGGIQKQKQKQKHVCAFVHIIE